VKKASFQWGNKSPKPLVKLFFFALDWVVVNAAALNATKIDRIVYILMQMRKQGRVLVEMKL
jgi:hypothetical protein